jgi:hypothetical protein
VVDADLEGIVAKHLGDTYHPKLARWQKVSLDGALSRRLVDGIARWRARVATHRIYLDTRASPLSRPGRGVVKNN